MKAIIVALLIVAVLSGSVKKDISSVASSPLPTIVRGTASKFYLDGKASSDFLFKTVSVPDFVTIGTDGLFNCDPKNAGAWPVEVKLYDKVSGDSQVRQYNVRVVEKASEDRIWAYNSDNYYERASVKPFRVVLGDAPSTIKVGNNWVYNFQTENGKGDLVYSFFGLPAGLVADRKTGMISGTVSASGIYTLGCEVADQAGNSAEGFVTVTVVEAQQTELSNVQLETKVSYRFDLAEIRQEQIAADRELFDALAVVNAAKAKLAAKKAAFDQLESELALAETEADKAAAEAAKAKAERERAAERLRLTNKALNDAQDQLNLALLDQAAAADAVIAAQDAVSKATSRFPAADATLKAAEAAVQKAEADLSVARENLLKAENNLKNAQKEFARASQDLSDAKDDLERAIRRKELADQDVAKAQDALKLAQQAYNDAKASLEAATKALASAEAKRQQCLANLAEARYALEQAKNDLGAAEWDLEKALATLYQAQARKEAADRASALALAEGSTNLDGTRTVFKSLGGWEKDTSYTGNFIVQTAKDFGSCNGGSSFPKFAGSAKIVDIQVGIATLSTGQKITFGDCTTGLSVLRPGAEIIVDGVVNVDKKEIQAYVLREASLWLDWFIYLIY